MSASLGPAASGRARSGVLGAVRAAAIVVLAVGLGAVLAVARAHAAGVAVSGRDAARVQLPVSAWAEDYDAAGYRLRMDGGVAEVRVELSPLASAVPFAPVSGASHDPIVRLAASITATATTRYQASGAVLDWIARNVRYELDRSLSQEPASVLDRRSGYCTGVARLAVALLAAVEVPAREVAGFVAGEGAEGEPGGYHRWIEVYYEDRGWVPSDPLRTHHYVPASYVRLASEALLPLAEVDDGRLIDRADRRRPTDIAPASPAGVSVRPNVETRWAGALEVNLRGAREGDLVLVGAGERRTRRVTAGRGTFLGLGPGTYRLTLHLPGRAPMQKLVVFRDRVQGSVTFETSDPPG